MCVFVCVKLVSEASSWQMAVVQGVIRMVKDDTAWWQFWACSLHRDCMHTTLTHRTMCLMLQASK